MFHEEYARAIKLLAARDLFSNELRAKVAAEQFDGVVARLQAQGILNDHRLAARVATSLAASGRGPLAIRQKLESRGVPGALVDEVVGNLSEFAIDEEISARIRKGDGIAKVGRFLASRGFDEDAIETILSRHFS